MYSTSQQSPKGDAHCWDLYDLGSQEPFVYQAINWIEGSILIICLFFWECQTNVLAGRKAMNQCDSSEPEGV